MSTISWPVINKLNTYQRILVIRSIAWQRPTIKVIDEISKNSGTMCT